MITYMQYAGGKIDINERVEVTKMSRNNRCKICGKTVGKLYNGLCAGCLSIQARENSIMIEDLLNMSDLDDRLAPDSKEVNSVGGVARLLRSPEYKALSEKAKKEMETGKPNKEDKVNKVMSSVKGEMTDKDKKAYRKTIEFFTNKYGAKILTGEYSICKKSEFGKDDTLGGRVIEEKGGMLVYGKPEYYDPDKITIDVLHPENNVLEDEEDENDDFDDMLVR